ncbi:hypothetical protein PM082_006245 [Marasmius tenuissimus]|nr:hypothetical protein PM082_006245 [Marasmius tenuissimus]
MAELHSQCLLGSTACSSEFDAVRDTHSPDTSNLNSHPHYPLPACPLPPGRTSFLDMDSDGQSKMVTVHSWRDQNSNHGSGSFTVNNTVFQQTQSTSRYIRGTEEEEAEYEQYGEYKRSEIRLHQMISRGRLETYDSMAGQLVPISCERSTFLGEIVSGSQKGTIVIVEAYEGSEAPEDWRQSFVTYSRHLCVNNAHLLALNRSKVPLLIFLGGKTRTDHTLWKKYGAAGSDVCPYPISLAVPIENELSRYSDHEETSSKSRQSSFVDLSDSQSRGSRLLLLSHLQSSPEIPSNNNTLYITSGFTGRFWRQIDFEGKGSPRVTSNSRACTSRERDEGKGKRAHGPPSKRINTWSFPKYLSPSPSPPVPSSGLNAPSQRCSLFTPDVSNTTLCLSDAIGRQCQPK